MNRLPQFASLMLKVSGLIGRKDFAAAIQALESHAVGNPTETECLNLLAQCHRWSGADDKAIEVAEKVLGIDPHDFTALKLLSETLAHRGDHQRAAACVRRGLERYPEEMSPLPYFLVKLARVAMRILRPRRKMSAQEFEPWESINAENRAWFQWAKEYLAWFDDNTGSKTLPVLH
jgi:tetratricopeptide (TPR) repeat protein